MSNRARVRAAFIAALEMDLKENLGFNAEALFRLPPKGRAAAIQAKLKG